MISFTNAKCFPCVYNDSQLKDRKTTVNENLTIENLLDNNSLEKWVMKTRVKPETF